MNKEFITNTYDLINSVSDKTKELFELDDILYDISLKLFDYRMEKKLKQRELATILGVTQAMISKLESGMYNPTVELLWRISKKLNFEFDIVFKEKGMIERSQNMWKVRNRSKRTTCSKSKVHEESVFELGESA